MTARTAPISLECPTIGSRAAMKRVVRLLLRSEARTPAVMQVAAIAVAQTQATFDKQVEIACLVDMVSRIVMISLLQHYETGQFLGGGNLKLEGTRSNIQ